MKLIPRKDIPSEINEIKNHRFPELNFDDWFKKIIEFFFRFDQSHYRCDIVDESGLRIFPGVVEHVCQMMFCFLVLELGKKKSRIWQVS